MLDHLRIRPETPADNDTVHAVLKASFGPDDPAVPPLVDSLRRGDRLTCALVAEVGGVIIGFAATSDAFVDQYTESIAAVAPVGVVPAFQGRGVGRRLMDELLTQCRRRDCAAAVVLGDPAWYSRFGFGPAAAFDLHCHWTDGPEFQAMELIDGALDTASGQVHYDACFDALGG